MKAIAIEMRKRVATRRKPTLDALRAMSLQQIDQLLTECAVKVVRLHTSKSTPLRSYACKLRRFDGSTVERFATTAGQALLDALDSATDAGWFGDHYEQRNQLQETAQDE